MKAGVASALGAALLFGVSTPLAKLLLGEASPWLLAGLLYLGSGIGLAILRQFQGATSVRLARGEAGWLAGAVAAGGILGPALLMWGLARMPASGAALLLNAEAVFTALIAWFVFRENFDRRIVGAMGLIVAGALVLSWPGEVRFGDIGSIGGIGSTFPALAVLGACLAWGIDNNLTRKVSLADAGFIAMVKGLVAGATNTALALLAGAAVPTVPVALAAGAVGFLGYGISLVLFVLALRHLGAARTGAYFSAAPFAGALVAIVLLAEPITVQLLCAAFLMGCGVWLHLNERHEHEHMHEPVEHAHEHAHDAHHQHAHDVPVAPGTRHTHMHSHDRQSHSHAHFPDAHHRHGH